MIAGHGVDIVEIYRIKRAYQRFGDRLLARLLTRRELAYLPDFPRFYSSLAGRFAAKEAAAKALGTGIGRVNWVHIEIVPEPSGKPTVVFSGAALETADALSVYRAHLSISHARAYAVASVVLEERPAGDVL